MDVLKAELEKAFSIQKFDRNFSDTKTVRECRNLIQSLTEVNNGCAVLSDLAAGRSYFSIGSFGEYLGLSQKDLSQEIIESLDEDCIYQHIHPEDLVDKRMLELKFFTFLCSLPIQDRSKYRSNCRIRMLNNKGTFSYISNRTHILRNDPCGNMWLALCQYDISPDQAERVGINSQIINTETGEVTPLFLNEERMSIISEREKSILQLIKEGYLSKEIARELNISVNTVNRHRQNILQKLCVKNSLEAIRAAEIMKLL
jgi:Response regulator containing a CheY-like receiver domain and an HTH DNA-binding domain